MPEAEVALESRGLRSIGDHVTIYRINVWPPNGCEQNSSHFSGAFARRIVRPFTIVAMPRKPRAAAQAAAKSISMFSLISPHPASMRSLKRHAPLNALVINAPQKMCLRFLMSPMTKWLMRHHQNPPLLQWKNMTRPMMIRMLNQRPIPKPKSKLRTRLKKASRDPR